MKMLLNIKKNLAYYIPLSIILGVSVGYFIEIPFIKDMILPITFLMIYPQMVNLNISELVKKPNLKLKLASVVINFIISPIIAFSLGTYFFKGSPVDAVGLFLISLLPTGSMSIALTGMSKGNLPSAIRISIFSLLLGAFVTPFYLVQFMGTVIDVDFWVVAKKIIAVIVFPLIAGLITRFIVIRKTGVKDYKKKFGEKIGLISSAAVLVMIFSIMSMKSHFFLNNPVKILWYIIPLVIFYFSLYIISTLVGKYFFSRADTLSLVFSTALRHLSISLAVAITSFGERGLEMALIISMAFALQIKMGVWYVKLCDRFLGRDL